MYSQSLQFEKKGKMGLKLICRKSIMISFYKRAEDLGIMDGAA